MSIRLYPDPVLRAVAQPVAEFGLQTNDLFGRLIACMREAGGIGLAATQIGVMSRLIVVDITAGEQEPLCLANPRVVASSDEMNTHEEGCLSIPGVTAPVKRPAEVTVEALDEKGEPVTIEASELLATCLQHEIDHLDGKLFIDRVSRLRRARLLSQYRKLQAEQHEEAA